MLELDLPKSRRALLLIDFINPLDFPEARDLAPPALQAARCTRRLAQAARRVGVPVIYANDNFGRWKSDFSGLMTSLVQGTGASAKMARSLKPGPRDLIVLKPMHSAFFGTPLDMLVDRIGVRSIVMAGLATDMCIQISAADAFLRGLKICVPEDCTAAETAEKKASALRYMRSVLKCDTRPWNRLPWTR